MVNEPSVSPYAGMALGPIAGTLRGYEKAGFVASGRNVPLFGTCDETLRRDETELSWHGRGEVSSGPGPTVTWSETWSQSGSFLHELLYLNLAPM